MTIREYTLEIGVMILDNLNSPLELVFKLKDLLLFLVVQEAHINN